MSDRIDFGSLINNARGKGKTTAMAEAVKKVGGVLLTRDGREALRVSKAYGIKAAYYGTNIHGIRVPILIDPDAVAVIGLEMEREMDTLRTQLAAKSAEAERLREALEAVTPEFEKYMMALPSRGDIQVLQKCVAALAPRAKQPAGEG